VSILRCTFCTATLLTGLKTGGRPGRLRSAESNYPSIDILPDFAKNRPECILLKTDSPGPGNNFSRSEKTPGFFNDLITPRKEDMIVSKYWSLGQDARIITETSLVDREAIRHFGLMRCARCRRDMPSVHRREEFCPSFLCDDCYEYEKTRQVFKLNTNRDESQRLYDRLWELSKKIDDLRKEDETLASQKKANPLFNKHFHG
jgi:hypothetical protein